MSLYNKYRPKTLTEFYANRGLIEALETNLSDPNKIPHALLFTGPSGCGKTTLARIVKNVLGCHDMDYTELDAATYRSIDDVREIRQKMGLKPIAGSVRVWLLDEVHMLGTGGASEKNAAQNALLKALEDMPPHVYFILATTEPQMLLKTIKTRCMTFDIPPLASRQMIKLLRSITEKENKSEKVSDEIIELIARESLGSPRAAIVSLEKVIDLDNNQQAKAVEKAMSEANQAIDLCKVLIRGGVGWSSVSKILNGLQEQQPESVRRLVLQYAQSVLLKEDNVRAFAIIRLFKAPTYDAGWPMIVANCYELMEMEQ